MTIFIDGPRFEGGKVLHDTICERCGGFGEVEQTTCGHAGACPCDAVLARCGCDDGVVMLDECTCLSCQALCLAAGIFTADEVDPKALALLHFWRKRGIHREADHAHG